MYQLSFKNISSTFVTNCFIRAFEPYKALHHHEIVVQKRSITSSTMRAQPIIDRFFWNKSKRRYKIEISSHAKLEAHIRIDVLPEEVLIGWFAHELGHIMDYLDRGVWSMIRFGIGYQNFNTFRIGAERKADIYAIEHGFARHILETKKYILEHSSLPDVYKSRIERYYMSPKEVLLLVDQNNSDEDLDMDKLFG
ncbi:MAG: hypothetical protein DHS20C18_16110 [Saprospiraceae bacterium]|nr:MAG: hypothetical protein DHS20C18_16110 [Saprospiraceae bacterium]